MRQNYNKLVSFAAAISILLGSYGCASLRGGMVRKHTNNFICKKVEEYSNHPFVLEFKAMIGYDVAQDDEEKASQEPFSNYRAKPADDLELMLSKRR